MAPTHKKYIKVEEKDVNVNNGREPAGSVLSSLLGPNKSLCTLEELPPHLQFNVSVLKGYRRLSKLSHCLFSLFFFHNETWNILTHLPMAIYTLIYSQTFWPWERLAGRPYLYGLGLCHSFAMVVPWIPSCFYHTFMCHCGGERVYDTLLAIDVIGIWMTEFFGSLTGISAAVWRLPEGLQGFLIGTFVVMSFCGLVRAITAQNPPQRVFSFAPLLIGRILSIMLRLSSYGGGNPAICQYILLQDVLSVIGGLIGAARVPERWIPGKCDYLFNSHNIMHIMVILAVLAMNEAANGDVQWILAQENRAQTPPMYFTKM